MLKFAHFCSWLVVIVLVSVCFIAGLGLVGLLWLGFSSLIEIIPLGLPIILGCVIITAIIISTWYTMEHYFDAKQKIEALKRRDQ